MKKYFILLGLLFLSQVHFAQQKPSVEKFEVWDGTQGDWRNSTSTEFKYDDQNRIIQEDLYVWRRTQEEWVISTIRRYEYNNAGLLSSYKRETIYDLNTQSFDYELQEFYEYNSAGKLTLETKKITNHTAQTVEETSYRYEFDENNCQVKYIVDDQLNVVSECNEEAMVVVDSTYNDNGRIYKFDQYEYDEFGNRMVTQKFSWNANTNQASYLGTRFHIVDEEGESWYFQLIQLEDYMDYEIERTIDATGRLTYCRLQVFDKNTAAIYEELLLERSFDGSKLKREYVQAKDQDGNIIDERELIYNYDEDNYLFSELLIDVPLPNGGSTISWFIEYEYNCMGLLSNFVRRLTDEQGFIGASITSYDYDELVNCDQIKTGQLNLYPNPTNGIFNVLDLSLNASDMNLRIFDVKGVLIKQENTSCQGGYLEFDASDLPNGFYFVNINNGEINKTEKLLIVK